MNHDDEDLLAARLRRALQDEADRISPSGDGLGRIRARTGERRFRRGWWLRSPALVLGAAAVAGVAAGTVIVTSNRPSERDLVGPATRSTPSVQVSPPPASPGITSAPVQTTDRGTTPTASQPAAPPPRLTGTMAVTVYYLGGTRSGSDLRLYRERHQVPATLGVIRAAVNAMLTRRPEDLDYRSAWPSSTEVRGVNLAAGTITVDLPQAAAARTASAAETRVGVQQLVYTATEAARNPSAGVRLRVEGRDVSTLWGHSLGPSPLHRADPTDVLAPVWVTSPGNGATVGRTFRMKGEAAVFEANVNWEIGAAGGGVVKDGFVTASIGAPGRGTWSQSVTLPPGRYELRAFETSAKDGARLWPDTKTIVVR
jgi:hypothetical protein